MSNLAAQQLITAAFDRLAAKTGYSERPDQRQLALLLSDLMQDGTKGMVEAPTGLGKSLAALIPAIAYAITAEKRVVIATYTNVLAEQYWRQDLPLALSLFDASHVTTALLMGRQRYACLSEMEVEAPHAMDDLLARSPLGLEGEFRSAMQKGLRMPPREITKLWQKVAVPPVCPGRFCPNYIPCYYFTARRKADKASIVITNHAVVLQDAQMAVADDESGDDARKGLLGSYDYLILDEAHDFTQAAMNALEFVIDRSLLQRLSLASGRIENTLFALAQEAGQEQEFSATNKRFRQKLLDQQAGLMELMSDEPGSRILDVSPAELRDHPAIRTQHRAALKDKGFSISSGLAEAAGEYVKAIERHMKVWREDGLVAPERVKAAAEPVRVTLFNISSAGAGAMSMTKLEGGSVSYAGVPFGKTAEGETFLRHDIVDLKEPLRQLIWHRKGWTCLSATLAVDSSFEHFERLSGAQADFTEILPSPFDHAMQSALYLPKESRLMDPTIARKEGRENEYHDLLAREIEEIIRNVGGRTLVLFHSRKEMEATFQRLRLPEDLPVLMQAKWGAAGVGERFKAEISSTLFALRSFWTGFDAPGETLSCVVLTRVPFEVPVDPPQIARIAAMQLAGLDPFGGHALPQAKMMIRQGVGRLIRRQEDKGIVALLDLRLRTKRYGDEILDNLPPDMRRFDDIADAVGWIGIEPLPLLKLQ